MPACRSRPPNEHRAVPCPRPGGEPLLGPQIFLDWAHPKTFGGKRGSPGTTQRVLLAGGLCCEGIDQRGRRNPPTLVFPGSRLSTPKAFGWLPNAELGSPPARGRFCALR